jgi:metal-dependent hydrolase (beta-lactamase superfamily II)
MAAREFSGQNATHGHRVLLDTGAHTDTVLQNAGDLKIRFVRC